VGVDVFFVLSGFLITRLLLKELAATGSISLPSFWARRARRLLPASTLVVVATVLVGFSVLAPLQQRPLALDVLATATFVVNFRFAGQLGDYFGAQLGALNPSPLLHFWSLAVEEQFYLVWPALMLLLTRRPRRYRRLLGLVIGCLGIASIAGSVWLTDHRPTAAFYLLPARMYELIAGALLAIAGSAVTRVPAAARAAAGWIGFAAIALATLRFDESIAFPGIAALLPVVGTVLVVVAGGVGAHALAPSMVLDRRPLQWIGRHTYAIYLWHWPALVLGQAAWGPLSGWSRALLIAESVGLASLSVRLVEDPVRRSPWLGNRARRGLWLGGALVATLLVTAAVASSAVPTLDGGQRAAAPTLVPVTIGAPTAIGSSTGATGATGPLDLAGLVAANRLVLEQGLHSDIVPSNLNPSLAHAADDKAQLYPDGCVAIGVDAAVKDCEYGVAGSAQTIVLYGDSHAAHWFPALEAIATARGARLVVFTKGGCPTAAVSIPTNTLARTCPQWRDSVVQRIADLRPDMIVMSASARYPNSDEEWQQGMQATVARLTPYTRHLIILGDNPGAASDPATCLSQHLTSASSCSNRRAKAVESGRIAAEQAVAQANGGRFIDTSEWLCTPQACPVVLGDILMYRDANHLSTTGARWLEPLLAAALFPS
ncbi:MAG: acyltransferase family protein, partial [Ilumatobacteraceae bacterium]